MIIPGNIERRFAMANAKKTKKYFYAILIALLVSSGTVFSGVIISTPQPAFSQVPDPPCVCAGCNKPCGSGHTEDCPYRPK
jgi:hypothetical protein